MYLSWSCLGLRSECLHDYFRNRCWVLSNFFRSYWLTHLTVYLLSWTKSLSVHHFCSPIFCTLSSTSWRFVLPSHLRFASISIFSRLASKVSHLLLRSKVVSFLRIQLLSNLWLWLKYCLSFQIQYLQHLSPRFWLPRWVIWVIWWII